MGPVCGEKAGGVNQNNLMSLTDSSLTVFVGTFKIYFADIIIKRLVPKAGFEPARVFPTTPSRWRVYQVPPLRHIGDHLLSGAGVGGTGLAGAAGAVWVAAGLPAPCIIEGGCCRPRKVSAREVHMKRIAATAVSLARKGAAPVEPKTVWLDPPKAAPIPAPLPCCKSTMQIKARETIT
jgi:hypothetical protein